MDAGVEGVSGSIVHQSNDSTTIMALNPNPQANLPGTNPPRDSFTPAGVWTQGWRVSAGQLAA